MHVTGLYTTDRGQLSINGSGGNAGFISINSDVDTERGIILLSSGSRVWKIYNPANDPNSLIFNYNPDNLFTFKSTGMFGIGTTVPGYTIDIAGTGSLGVGGSVTFSGLPIGTGTSILYISSAGVLTKGTLPTGSSYTAGNGITLAGTVLKLGSSLTENSIS